jgi:hypothetical protein
LTWEGRSFEVGNQVLISSHRKLLLPLKVLGEHAAVLASGKAP